MPAVFFSQFPSTGSHAASLHSLNTGYSPNLPIQLHIINIHNIAAFNILSRIGLNIRFPTLLAGLPFFVSSRVYICIPLYNHPKCTILLFWLRL